MTSVSSQESESRARRLDGFEVDIFQLVRDEAPFEQWREWLRLPLERAAAAANGKKGADLASACRMEVSEESEDRSRLDGFEVEIFKLVRQGATSEQWREWLRAPLEHAAAKAKVELFTRLMDAGADGSAGWRAWNGRTLLIAAADGKSEEIVSALLGAGAKDDIDVQFGDKQESALHVAIAAGAEGAARALMIAGANPNLQDIEKQTPLHLAAQRGYCGVVSDLLERGADKDRRNSDGATPLCLAAESNQLEAVDELLAAEADPDIRATRLESGHQYKCRPLDIAARRGHSGVVEALLRRGGDVKACDEDGNTALSHAAEDYYRPHIDNGDVVRMLLGAGADVQAKTDGTTPLHLATHSRSLLSSSKIRALLEGGADVNARDELQRATPLHNACITSNVEGVRLLLRWGADETITNLYGDTAGDLVGKWEEWGWEEDLADDEDDEDVFEYQDEEKRKADDERIRQMLARAPAERSWRRRRLLVLARYRPDRVQLAIESHTTSIVGGSARGPKARSDGLGERKCGDGEQAMTELGSLVRTVVALEAESLFRLVIGFL